MQKTIGHMFASQVAAAKVFLNESAATAAPKEESTSKDETRDQ